MTSNKVALLAGVACIAVFATYAWAATQEAAEVKTEDAAKVEESAEAAPLCIPMAAASEATEASDETATEEAKTEEATEEAKTEEATEEAKADDGAEAVALPICDEDGNPPAPEGDTAAEEKTEEAAKEPAKTE